MILAKDRIRDIMSVPLTAMVDLWDEADRRPDLVASQTAQRQYARQISGNGAALVQRIVACADDVVGFAPWQRSGIIGIADLPTAQLVAGELMREIGNRIIDVARGTLEEVLAELARAVDEFLRPFLDLSTSIPVAGQIIDLVATWVMGIVDMVRLAKQSERAQQAEPTGAPAAPIPSFDMLEAEAVATMCRGGDWTPIWLPYADPSGDDDDWRRGWGCEKLTPEGEFGGGRLIAPLTTWAWSLGPANPVGFGNGMQGLGAVPGYGENATSAIIHRRIQVSDRARIIVDTGAVSSGPQRPPWMPLCAGAALQAWGLLWGESPTAWAIDPRVVLKAWERYAGAFLLALERGDLCHQTRAETRTAIRKFFLREILNVPESSTIEQALDRMPMRKALTGLIARQEALAGTTTVAYVNARTAPRGLRSLLERRQIDLVGSPELGRIDLWLVSDPLYRAKIEMELSRRGQQPFRPGEQSALTGPDRFDRNARRVPAPPASALPRIPPMRSSTGKPSRANSRPRSKPKSFWEEHGGEVAIIASLAAVGGVAALYRYRQQLRR